MLRMAASRFTGETGMKNLCLAGGVALNCVGNGRILREGPFENLWIQPAAGDAGGALGAALFIWHQLLGNPRTVGRRRQPARLASGPAISSDDEIRAFLDVARRRYRHFADERRAVRLRGRPAGRRRRSSAGSRGAWSSARGRWAAAAFWATPAAARCSRVMNLKIKFRESFRPFAPVGAARTRPARYFEMATARRALTCCWSRRCAGETRWPCDGEDSRGRASTGSSSVRSDVPAVTHVDYSARVQTVDAAAARAFLPADARPSRRRPAAR